MLKSAGRALALGLFITVPAFAARLPFRFYRNPDGLPQSQVMALHQDRRGEIWVGTWCGAGRFDGARFRNLSQASGLPSNYIYAIAEDREGSLWLAAGYGVVRIASERLDTVAESFYPIAPASGNSSVRDLHFDRKGTLWAASTIGGVARRSGSGFTLIPAPEIDIDALQVIAETGDGELLLGTRAGIQVIRGNASHRWRDAPGPWNEPIRMLYQPVDGPLWFATATQLFRMTGELAVAVKSGDDQAIPLVRSVHQDRRGRMWIATEAGLYMLGPEGMVRYGVANGLFNERVYAILEDREGNLWFGTDDGLAKYAGDLLEIYLGKAAVPDDSAWSLGLDAQGKLLAGFRHGVARFDGSRFIPWPLPNPLSDKTVRAIVADTQGGLWFGTRSDGLFHWDGKKWRQFKPPEYPELRTYSAFRDRHGTLWFGTRDGVARWNGDGFTVWRQAEGLPDSTVWMIREDPAGRIVVSTDRGMARLERERFIVPDEYKPFANTEVRSFVHDDRGDLWVGTNGSGLFHRTQGKIVNLRAGEGPTDDFVWGMTLDTQRRLWVGTNHGFDVFDGKSWINYSSRDGLVSEEIAVNGALATSDGAVWFAFGGDAGIVRFNPRPFTTASLAPLVRITDVVLASGRAEIEPGPLHLPWKERDLTFHYIGVSFRDERRVIYQTQLAGYDKEFSQSRPERSVRYTNLAPGKYRFLVKATGVGGLWSEPASIEVEVLAPFWRRWWFYFLAAAAALLALAGYVRWRLQGVVREKLRLEGMVAARTRDLEEKIAQVEELREKFEQLSITDALTGLYNRRHIREQIEREIARAKRHGESIGVALIDLDHFKTINDRFGHPAGDTVLVHYARMLSDWFRKSDLVARYGGEEFIVAFLNADEKGPHERTEKLREKMATQKIEIAGQSLAITLSAGVVIHAFTDPKDPTTVDDLLRMADERLYRAKSAGRNKVITQ